MIFDRGLDHVDLLSRVHGKNRCFYARLCAVETAACVVERKLRGDLIDVDEHILTELLHTPERSDKAAPLRAFSKPLQLSEVVSLQKLLRDGRRLKVNQISRALCQKTLYFFD